MSSPPRRLSISSNFSDESNEDHAHSITAVDSSTALILVPDDDAKSFEFSDDEDSSEDEFGVQFDSNRVPLSSSDVFVYLLSPCLKLGAMLVPNIGLQLKFSLPALFLFAVLSAYVRQIWFMLARYLRKTPDMEEVILDAFARGRGKVRRRAILRSLIRAGTGCLRVLLAVIYLRESAHALLPLITPNATFLAHAIITVLLSLLLVPFYMAESLGSRRLIYATWTSIGTYVLWLIVVSAAHAQGTLEVSPGWLRKGTLWQGISVTAFVFTSSWTLPLHTSLKVTHSRSIGSKPSKSRSFRMLSALSVAIAVCLILPLVFFSAKPNHPETPSSALQPYIRFFYSITLLLAIPPNLITTPTFPIPDRLRRLTTFSISKFLTFVVVLGLSIAPNAASGVISDILILIAFLATYFLPAFIHITTHFFKRPLSIVIPQPPQTPNPNATPRTVPSTPTRNSSNDELLQRKERSLQKRVSRRRIIWDLGVWILLLPVGGGGFVWSVGRLAGKW